MDRRGDNPLQMYADGVCYGAGVESADVRVEDGVRRGTCPVCGERVGITNPNSVRICSHKHPLWVEDRRREQRARMELHRIRASRMNVAQWIHDERKQYADVKYGESTEARHKLILETKDFGLDGEWMVFIGGYLKRAELIGLDTPAGRQALGKAIVTCIHALETAVLVHGAMPAPGVPSGEIEPWNR